jgi:peptidoglycan/xylan/chitin deacetylase (PgdA/CDA1 family)
MSAHLADRRTECVMGEVPVLMYHSIAAGTTGEFARFAVDPTEFAEQMDYLDAAGYRTMTAADLVGSRRGRPLPPRPVVLTFDDAYADFYSTALPVLREHDFCATLYVPTGYVGGTASFLSGLGEGHRPVLSWQALRDIAAAGVEMAAHSHTHPQLDRVPTAVINDEVRRSRCLLEDNLGLAVDGFAYPFGYWNRAARAAVAAAGFQYAVAVAELMTTARDDVLTLPRLTVNAGLGVAGLARLLGTRPTPVRQQVAATKRIIWRAMRGLLPAVGGDAREGWPPRDGG